jgi:hypothetical protein
MVYHVAPARQAVLFVSYNELVESQGLAAECLKPGQDKVSQAFCCAARAPHNYK